MAGVKVVKLANGAFAKAIPPTPKNEMEGRPPNMAFNASQSIAKVVSLPTKYLMDFNYWVNRQIRPVNQFVNQLASGTPFTQAATLLSGVVGIPHMHPGRIPMVPVGPILLGGCVQVLI